MMDTRQPATKDKRKRESSNMNPVQTHSMETRSALNKRRKQETDPLKMGHVLEKIFSFLDSDSIKAARQVDPLWSFEGAKSLITKCYVKIPPELQTGESSTSDTTMDKFKLFLSHKSKDFPIIPNIIVGAKGDVELWKSLEVLGQQVKSLKLEFMDGQAKFLQKLFILLPNLKYLNCEGMCHLNNTRTMIEIIIPAMSKREKEGSSLTIPRMVLDPHNERELADMENLAGCKNLMIEDLELSYYCENAPNSEARTANALSKLLSTSQNALKKLILHNCEYYLPLLEFSCMTALTHMDLNSWSRAPGPACKFSPSFRFSEKIPNLQEIDIDYSTNLPDFLQNLLENTGAAPSVKRVNRREVIMENDIDALFKAFPNTKELKLHVNGDSESIFRSLWTLGKNLKKLDLSINWCPCMGDFPDLDFLFTGFDAETVKKIKETPNLDPYTVEELETLRVNPSISNLKELENLGIHFRGIKAKTVPKRMLTVAAKYEISQLPKDPEIAIKLELDNFGFTEVFDEVSKLPNFIVEIENYHDVPFFSP